MPKQLGHCHQTFPWLIDLFHWTLDLIVVVNSSRWLDQSQLVHVYPRAAWLQKGLPALHRLAWVHQSLQSGAQTLTVHLGLGYYKLWNQL